MGGGGGGGDGVEKLQTSQTVGSVVLGSNPASATAVPRDGMAHFTVKYCKYQETSPSGPK